MTKILSKIYGRAVDLKHFLYEHGLLDQVHLKSPVISVGNLTAGGTGKTPVVEFLTRHALSRNIKTAIISRSYKGQISEPQRVDLKQKFAARLYGDEPCLLQSKLPESFVFAGPKKYRTAAYAQTEISPDLYIIDDGFQHRELARDLDIVLLDATQPVESYKLFPHGLTRDRFETLLLADLVLITKVNLAEAENLKKLERMIPKDCKVLMVAYELKAPEFMSPTQIFGFAGLGNTGSFRKMLRSIPNAELVQFKSFSDHHAYTNDDIQRICKQAKMIGCSRIYTTEKDYIKIRSFLPDHDLIEPLALELKFLEEPQLIYEFFNKVRVQN